MSGLHGGGFKAIFDRPLDEAAFLDLKVEIHSRTGNFGQFDVDMGGDQPRIKFPDDLYKDFKFANRRDKANDDGEIRLVGYFRLADSQDGDELKSSDICDIVRAMRKGSESATRNVKDGCLPAAYTYFGQLIAHDITHIVALSKSGFLNGVSSPLDLDGVIFADEIIPACTYLAAVAKDDGVAIGKTNPVDKKSEFDDLPREVTGKPAIPDRRNDSNLALAQLHVGVSKYHQMTSDRVPSSSSSVKDIQEIVLFDYLRKIIDPIVWREVIDHGRGVVVPRAISGPFVVPIEFAAACFRFGHSMVRPQYKWNNRRGGKPAFTYQILQETFIGTSLTDRPLANDWVVDWENLIALRDSTVSPDQAEPIDLILAPELFDLPKDLFENGDCLPNFVPLAEQTLLRAVKLRLPSAQTLAKKLNSDLKRTCSQQSQIKMIPQKLLESEWAKALDSTAPTIIGTRTPLWIYTLIEANFFHGGRKLGPLASRVVMETLHAAIEASGTGLVAANEITQPIPDEAQNCSTLENLIFEASKWTNESFLTR